MGLEAQGRQDVVDYSSGEKRIRIAVLRQTIRDSQGLIAGLEKERAQLIMRLSQIPDSITTVREWMNGSVQELERLEGHGLSNGRSTSLDIPQATSLNHP